MEQGYIQEIIRKILVLQRQDFDSELSSCDRPFLGPGATITSYNTRPIQFYNSYTATPWTFSYTIDGVTSVSDVFRVESIEEDAVTVRLLALDTTTGQYSNTNQFVTIQLSTIGAMRCFADTFVTL